MSNTNNPDASSPNAISKTIWRFLISQLFSLLGSSIVDYVLIWYITLKSGSGMILALSLMVNFVPKILSSYYIEHRLQHCDIKKVLIYTDAATALFSTILAGIFFFQKESYPSILVFMAIRSAFGGIQSPCEKVFITEIVPKEDLLRVNAWNSSITALCRLLAPAVGGVLLSFMSMPAALMTDLLTAVGAVLVLCTIHCRYQLQEPEESRQAGDSIGKNASLLIRRYVLFLFFIVPVTYLTPLLVSSLYQDSVMKLAYNEIFYSLGAIAAGLLLQHHFSKTPDIFRRISSILSAGVSVLFLSLLSGHFNLYLLFMLLSALCITIFQIQTVTRLQNLSDSNDCGCIFSRLEMMSNIALPAGMLFWGSVSDLSGIHSALICSGAGLILLGVGRKSR